ncbi:hypothetical protein HpHA187_09170 [Helicobacter pylori]
MNQNTEQVSQNKGLNEFERAKIYYTKFIINLEAMQNGQLF